MKVEDKTKEQLINELIAARQQMEKALRESDDRYKRFVEAVTDYIYTAKVDNGHVVGTSHGPGCIAVTGYTSEEYENDPFFWYRMVHVEDRDAVIKQSERVLLGEAVLPFEHRIIHKNGTIHWVRNTIFPRYNEQGDLIAYDGLVSDITEHKQKEEFIKSIFESISEGLVVIDRQYRVITANRAYCHQVKMSVDNIKGKYCYELSHHLDKPCYMAGVTCPVKHTFATGQTHTYIHTHYDKEDNPVYVEIRSYPMKDLLGHVTSAIEVITDVTKAVILEQALKNKIKDLEESEDKFRKISVTAQDAIVVIDNEGNISYWNPAAEKIFGYTEKEADGKSLHALIVPDRFQEKFKKGFRIFKSTGQGYAIGKMLELTAIRKGGTEFPIELSLSAVKIKDKWNAIGIVRDITRRKRVEEKIKRDYQIQNTISSILRISLEPISLEEQLQRILELILSIPWLSLQSKGHVYLVEDDPDILVMKAQQKVSESQWITCSKIPIGKCICGQAASSRELTFVDHIDKNHTISYQGMLPHGHYCIPILSGNRLLGVICLYVTKGHKRKKEEEFLIAVADLLAGIIERKQAEDELKKYRLHLEKLVKVRTEALNNQREQFISMLVHDLKGPLVPMLGFTKRLIDGKAKSQEDAIEYTKIIHESSQELLATVENTSRDLRKKLTLKSFNPEELNIKDILLSSVTKFLAEIENKGLGLFINNKNRSSWCELEDVIFKGDISQLKTLIENLLGNAIKYAKSAIKIELDKTDSDIYFVISDDGPGIPEKYQEKIFEQYYQAPESQKGTGIGLYSVKKVAENHGGKIVVHSFLNKGASFEVILPI